MELLEALEAEVKKLADEATPELLPRILKIFLQDDRPGLMTCERHTVRLFPYVRAQINLTRAKRRYYNYADVHWPPVCHAGVAIEDPSESAYRLAESHRDEVRKAYRSTPCTCWVAHR